MKPIKLLIIFFSVLFLLSLIVSYYEAYDIVHGGYDRPQWEEEFSVLDYFISWSLISFIVNGFCLSVSICIYCLTKKYVNKPRLFIFFVGIFTMATSSCNRGQNKTIFQQDKVESTLSNYIKYKGFSHSEKEEFIKELCDTTNMIYRPVFFKYPDKINGYNVEGMFYIGADGWLKDNYGEPFDKVLSKLYFSSDSLTFEIYDSTFQPFGYSISNGINVFDCVELSYNEPNFPDPNKISLDSISELPFAFIDIDFDGIKELLFSNPGNGQKSISTYIAYKYPYEETIDPFEGYTWNQLDQWTEFDYENRTVISSLWGGYDGSEKWYFRYDGNKLKPYLKEEYTHWFDTLKASCPL